jgi:hypothetical protein
LSIIGHMDYYTELLKSYSLLKKRKLKLLVESEDPQAIAQAKKAVEQAKQLNSTTSNPFIAQGVRASVAIYFVAAGKGRPGGLKFAPVSSDGKPNTPAGKFVDSDFATLAGFFDPNEEGQSPAQAKNEKTPAGQVIQGSEFAELNPEESLEMAEAFQEIQMNFQDAFSNIPKKLMKGMGWESVARFANYLFGAMPQSLEKQITSPKLKIIFDPGLEEYITLQNPADPKVVAKVANNLSFLVKMLAQDNIGPDNKSKLLNMFIIHSNGNVSILTDIEDSGLVFEDGTGFLKNLLKATKEKFFEKSEKFETLNVKARVSYGIDNQIRGVALEEILPMLVLQKKLNEMRRLNLGDNAAIVKGIQQIYKQIADKMMKLKAAKESWVLAHRGSALNQEEVDIINGASTILGDTGVDLVQAIVNSSKELISTRNPDFVVAKGRETGEGRRQDVFEVYSDPSRATESLLKSGYSPEEIAGKGMVKSVPVEEAFNGREDLLGIALKSGIFKKGQVVNYVPTSLKNYIELDKAVFGTGTQSSTKDFIDGKSKDPENKFLKKYFEITGVDDAVYQKTREYNKSLWETGSQVRNLDFKVKAKSNSTGKTVAVNPFSSFLENTLRILKDASDYKELTRVIPEGNIRAKLASMATQYLEKGEDDEQASNKIKAYFAQYVKNTKLIGDIQKGDLAAKNYLAMKLFNCGGSVDDGLMCDYRGLESKENYNFLQNDVIREVLQSFMTGDGRWKLQAKDNTFLFVDATNPKVSIRVLDKVEKRDANGETVYSPKTSVEVSRNLLLKYSRKKKSAKESLIDAWMDQQKIILLELFDKEFITKSQ